MSIADRERYLVAMKKALLALLMLAGAVAFFLYEERDSGSGAASAIEREVERGPGHVFALADHTDFEWDRVYLFGPYSQREDVEARLGVRWQAGFDSHIESSDAIVLVVFSHEGRVVEHFDLPRATADLTPCVGAGNAAITRAAARFVVGNDGVVSLDDTAPGD